MLLASLTPSLSMPLIDVLAFFSPLYIVIPNDGGLQALAYFLDQRTLMEPSTHTLVRLAELVLTLNAFSFDDQHYRQIGGVAMGSKMGPNYTCLFV